MKRPSVAPLFPSTPDEGTMWLTWLVRLRWVAIFAQVITLAFVFNMLDGALAMGVWGTVTVLLVVANLFAVGRLNTLEEVPAAAVFGQLLLDVLALTAFFAIGGGPDNPFTPLYLVHVAMAAVMLPPRYAAGLTVIVIGCYALLFPVHLPLHYERHSLPEGVLIRLGQGISFAITAVSVALFVIGVAASLRRRKEQLLAARDRSARTDRLRSVGTLAAGAAHELNTPLSTMGLRLRRIGRRYDDPDTVRDVQVIREQLDRCTSIVQRLLVGAGDPSASDIERRPLGQLCRETVDMWAKGAPLEVQLDDDAPQLVVELPRVAFQQALCNLLENAREAQDEAGVSEPLTLRVYRQGSTGVVDIVDAGVGLPEALDQVGEPFYTTKSTGTGLGVFVARQVADGAGGGLRYLPRTSRRGTVARWWFPEAAPQRRTA